MAKADEHEIKQGESFTLPISAVSVTDEISDWSGYGLWVTIKSKLSESAGIVDERIDLTPESGVAVLEKSNEDTKDWVPGEYTGEIALVSPDGRVSKSEFFTFTVNDTAKRGVIE